MSKTGQQANTVGFQLTGHMLNSLDRIFPLHRARTFLIAQFAENFERDGIRETIDTGRRLPQHQTASSQRLHGS